MLVIDRMLASGLGFVMRRIAEAADAASDPTTALHAGLLDAQASLERNEITEAEYEAIEADLLAELHERRRSERPAVLSHVTVDVIETPPEVGEKGAHHAPPKRKARKRRV